MQFSVFYEVLQTCYFIFSVNERVVVIKQSIMVLSVGKQWKIHLNNKYMIKTTN